MVFAISHVVLFHSMRRETHPSLTPHLMHLLSSPQAPHLLILEVRDFDDFMVTLHSFRVLTKVEDPWQSCRALYQCSCEAGQKNGVCKHSLLQTKRAGGCEVPLAYKHGTTFRKRKRGAPKKTKTTLNIQLGEYYVPSESDESVET